MQDIYVIIGMDWLSMNNALLDCSHKIVSLPVHTSQSESKTELTYLSTANVTTQLKVIILK